MGLPFDLEDIFGVALADVLRRAALILGCLGGAAAITGLSFGVMGAVGDRDPMELIRGMLHGLVLLIRPVVTAWGILYLPLVIGAGIYFAKAEAPTLRGFLVLQSLAAVLMVLAAGDEAIRFVALPLAAGFIGAIGWLGWLLGKKRETEGELHLAAIAIENDLRRQQMRDEQGIVVADRDYVVEEEPR